MTNHIITMPFEERLLSKLKKRDIIIRRDNFDNIRKIYDTVENKNTLNAIWIETGDGSISSIPFSKEWAEIPLVIYANDPGPFKDLIKNINIMRELNILFFLPSDNPDSFTSLKILSSLGIRTGIVFTSEKINWDSIADLMYYAVYSKASHVPIEPFQFIVANYHVSEFTDFSSVYFNNPLKYLHINGKEQIALSYYELLNAEFIGEGIESINKIEENEYYQNRLTSWQEFFLKEDGCAYCPSWKICLGKFSETSREDAGCRDFFSDLMDASDFYQSQLKKNKGKKWIQ